MSSVLVVAAHADDETLGCGGTIAKLAAAGADVTLLIVTDGESSRSPAAIIEADMVTRITGRRAQAQAAAKSLGIRNLEFLVLRDDSNGTSGEYAVLVDQQLDMVSLLTLSRVIGEQIVIHRPETVFTHFPGDLNQDHMAVAHATLIATRPTPGQSVKHVYAYEVPSATGWSYGMARAFEPSLFSRLTAEQMTAKMEAMKFYTDEIPPWPHARSCKAVEAHAAYWGSLIGCNAAEAFMVLRSEF